MLIGVSGGGSFFSHHGKGAFKLTGRWWSKVQLVAAEPIPPAGVSAADLEQQVRSLRGDLA
ncbi:hypothetical protein WG68_00925 [Arsukibacterium ikkense]|uniref:Uncharacterized protein n=2 Tax=Arsukibacterium ikkense TaxID=336831 RepID=A0A0M2V9Y4_9GAMM|nr:hypothetical protein WG68_00925 [Arsukibacterium ikkense]